MLMKSRIIFLDFIRALAIILILMSHLPDYLGNYQIFEIFVPYFTNFGLGLFIFLSGYVIFLNNSSIHTTEDILAFYKKRAIRIFPLYLIALFVFFVIFGLVIQIFGRNLGMDFSLKNLIIHILGLQILLSPEYATPILTLYFIGLLVIFYLIYPLLIKFSHNIKEFFLISLIPFILFLFLRYFFNIIDDYFFRYYFVFIFGILFCYISSSSYKKDLKFLIITPIILVFFLALFSYYEFDADISNIFIYTILYIVIISFCLIQFEISNMFIDDFSPKTKNLIFIIAFSSYAIYLFHRPILTVFYGITLLLGLPEIIRDLIIIFVAIPSVFIISYYIQLFEEKILRNRR
jgi:peptidoglycan/LPS O-acetylase OafA/YrhL